MNVKQLYIKATSASMGAKIFTALGAVIVIWLINNIGEKAVFGYVMLAYALTYILATALAAMFQSILIYHTSRNANTNDKTRLGACLNYTLIIGIIIAVIMSALSHPLAHAMNKPDAAQWFKIMAWIIPAFAANSVLSSYYRARQDIPTMVTYMEILPMVFRLILFGVIAFFNSIPDLIAYSFVASYALPCATLWIKAKPQLTLDIKAFTLWDMKYGMQIMLSQLVNKSVRNLVLFALGFFVGAGAIADLSLAMRFGQFLQMPKLALAQLQAPRIGKFMQSNNIAAMKTEFRLSQTLSLALTIIGCITFLIGAPYIFAIFGNYDSAIPLLLILAIASLCRSGFGALGEYLALAGYAGLSLLINGLTALIVITSLFALVPHYDIKGAAITLVIGAIASMTLMYGFILYKDKFNAQTPLIMLATLTSSIALAAHVCGTIVISIALSLLVLSLIMLAADYRLKRHVNAVK